jgi:hypothetical protein
MNLAHRVGLLVALCSPLCQAEESAAPVLAPLPTEDRPLAERFAVPPPSARILRIVHAQRENAAEQDQQLRTLAAQGLGGFAGNVAFDGYLEVVRQFADSVLDKGRDRYGIAPPGRGVPTWHVSKRPQAHRANGLLDPPYIPR